MSGLLGWKSGFRRATPWSAFAGTIVLGLLAFLVISAVGSGGRGVSGPVAKSAAEPSGSLSASDALSARSVPRRLTALDQRRPAGAARTTAPRRVRAAEPRLTAAYRPASVRVRGSRWSGSLGLGEVGRGGKLVPVAGTLKRRAGGARYGAGGLEESFTAVPGGIEQSFTVSDRTPGPGPLVVQFGLAGLRASGSGAALVLHSAGHVVGLYSGLRVTDASGHVIAASMRPSAHGRRIVIDVSDEHARYPLRIDPTIAPLAEVTDPGATSGDEFGYSVAVSGSTAVVGAPGSNKVYVYAIGGGAWTQTAVLSDPGSQGSDEFGDAVAISGNTLVVGAPNSPYGAAKPTPGAAYVYILTGGVPGSPVALTPSDGAKNDGFGLSVATSGGTVVVGAPDHDSTTAFEGAVYVYGPSDAGWQETTELTPSDSGFDDQMGSTVGISESGSTIVAGAYDGAQGLGSAYVFTLADASWGQAALLTVPNAPVSTSTTLPAAVAISGSTIVVGGSQYANNNAGEAYVYTPSGSTWTLAATLDPADSGGFFSRSVAISGNTIVIGAFGHNDGNGNDQGAAYVFTGSGPNWTQQPTDLTAADGAPSDYLGWSVAVSGDEVVSGAYGHKGGGAAYLFGAEVQPGPTFTVTTGQDTNDGGCYVNDCSLRDAITAADAYAPPEGTGSPTIAFDIPGAGVHTIQPVTPLPAITAPMTIDATTQPGYAAGSPPVVVVNGGSVESGAASAGTLTGDSGGTSGVQAANSACPSGSVVTGLQVSQEGGLTRGQQPGENAGYVSQVAVICTAAGGAVTDGATIGDGTAVTVTPLNCPSGEVGLGISGHNGNVVDGIGIRCGYVGGTPSDGPSVWDGGGGTLQGPFDCPAGYEMIGLSGTYASYYGAPDVLSLTPVCVTPTADGLDVDAGGTTVRGLGITDFAGAGIAVSGAGGNVIGPENAITGNSGDGVNVSASGDGTQITGNSITGNAAGIVTDGSVAPPVLPSSSPDTGSTTALNATVSGAAGSQVAVEFFASATCDTSGSGEGGTYLGSTTTTIGSRGSAPVSVASGLPTAGEVITATATTTLAGDSSPSTSEFSNCSNVVSEPDNTTWTGAQTISLSGGAGSTKGSIDLSGEARWYKVPIAPGGSVQLNLTNLPADYNLALFSDISQAQASLTASSTSSLQTLSTELPGSSFSPSEFSPSEFSPSEFSPSEFSPSEFSPSEFSPSEFSPSEFSPSEFSPSEFSPSEFSPSVISPSEFSPSEFSPSEFSPSEFSPSTTVSDEQEYEDAQIQSLLAVSDNGGGADQTISADTWNNTGYFYIRVTGANGAYDPGADFSLGVQVNAGTCGSVAPSSAQLLSSSSLPASSYQTLILTDESRMSDDGELSKMEGDLSKFANLPSVNGTIFDVNSSPQVAALQTQADAHQDCPYAENLVADSIRNVVLAERAADPSLKYVVIIGDDHVIPFFRYPDTAGIGPESGYVPPVLNTSSSFASLESDDFLSQDAYGASTLLDEDGVEVPVPDLPVGRLVETPTEIDGMLQAYMNGTNGGVVSAPTSSLVTGYDFMARGADAVESDFSAGLGSGATNDTLITNDGVPPSQTGTPPNNSWTASQLETALLSKRHDLIYLGAHFSANNTLAADYSTTMNAEQLASSSVNLENSIVLSPGCHAGYNIVSNDAVPGVTQTLDWVGAFAQKGATLIAGTGYQYGDTDFLAYSDQLYADFSHALRYGSGPVALGSALVDAKSTYLENNPDVQGIDIKSLLEATLYGLPMLSVNLPSGRIPDPTSTSTVASTTPESSGPGSDLGLSSTDVTLSPTLTTNTTQLESLSGGAAPTATYLSGPNGVQSSPAEPTLPLAESDVSVPGEVLRGVGFTGGTYTDQSGITPLTGAPATELSGVHSTFSSGTFFPSELWTVNYFGALTGGSTGTQLMLTPVQYESDAPGSLTDTQRSYSSVGLRLFYSDNTSSYGANTPALAAPPTISEVSASADGSGDVTFQAHVVGDPSAGIQQVWVTYTGVNTPTSGTGEWQSLNLTQSATDSTLWTGTITGLSTSQLSALRFMVQAANGVGLVGLDDNDGSYYALGQITGGLQSQTLASTALTLSSPPSSGAYGSSVPVSATLTAGGNAVSGALVDFTIGSATAEATTDANGVAQTDIELTGAPGSDYQLTASYDGSTTQAGTSITAPFTVNKVATTLTLAGSGNASLGASTGITATLKSGGLGLQSYSVAFVLTPTGGGLPIVQTAVTGLGGVAALGAVPQLNPGTYSVQAFFGSSSALTLPVDPILLPSQSGSSNLTVIAQPLAIQSANATTFTIGTAGTFTVTSTGNPTNAITNANFSGCTRTASLPAGVTLTDNGNNTATLAGTPAAGTAGTYTLCLNASNGNGTAATQQFTLTVARATPTTPMISNLPAPATYGASFVANVATNGDGATSVTSSTATVCTVGVGGKVSFVGVGPCTLTAHLAQGASYAAASGNPQTFTVAPAALKITASSPTITYGTPIPAITPSYATFVNGDTPASLKTLPSCKTTATPSSAPASYPTSCTGAADPNYTITYVPGSLTVNQASEVLTYTGAQTASTKSTFVPAATLSSGPSACDVGQPVAFTLNLNPITGTAGPYTLETATSSSAGVATGAAISTAQWQYGSYTLTATYAGNVDCAGSVATVALSVTEPGLATSGVGIYTAPGAGSVSFGFAAGLKPGTTSTYCGALALVDNLRWQLIATVASYAKSNSTTGALSGKGSLYWWNPALNRSKGGWDLAASDVSYTATITATTKSSPGSFGIKIAYTPAPGQPSPLPNSAPITITKGSITLN